MSTADSGRQRGSADVHRYLVSHFLAVIGEWAALIGLLVYAFERGGARAAGYASLAALAPYLLLSATTARLAQRHRPASVRWCSLAAPTLGYGSAAACALAEGPVVIAVAGTALAFTAVTALRPAGAVLLPALVRSSLELTTTNVRVGHCESASVLLGPLAATGLLQLGGGGMVLMGCTGLVALAAATATVDVRHGPPAADDNNDNDNDDNDNDTAQSRRPRRTLAARLSGALLSPFANVVRVGRRPGARGVLAAAMGQYVLVGAFDIILVVIAGEHLDLGAAGAGILTTMFGAGAFLSIGVAGRAVRRPRLAPQMLLALALIATACIAFGANITLLMAGLALPVLGCSRSLLDLMARVLLQRSAPPSQLASVFGALETSSGIGLIAGSLLAQTLIAVSGASVALVGVGCVYGVLAVSLIRPLRSADDGADVPVVAMSLLHRLPVFAPLPTLALEAVARSAIELPVAAGEVVIHQGDSGDRFYAVADGAFDVVMSAVLMRTVRRGEGFGEVALLADVPRTATVTATQPGHLLAIERGPFLIAVTGHDSSRQAAWGVVRSMTFDNELPDATRDEPTGTQLN
ncbi:MAG: cyclic nucleotide-binding domain-containing protein [Actinobacteria bacterium]|nr:cyclic nucleotide-binding domain-containing protein [Actinomycetota bacterium]